MATGDGWGGGGTWMRSSASAVNRNVTSIVPWTSMGKSPIFCCGTNGTVRVRKPFSATPWVKQGRALTRSLVNFSAGATVCSAVDTTYPCPSSPSEHAPPAPSEGEAPLFNVLFTSHITRGQTADEPRRKPGQEGYCSAENFPTLGGKGGGMPSLAYFAELTAAVLMDANEVKGFF